MTVNQLAGHASRKEGKKPLCFRSEERFVCRELQCPLRKECMKLVARWRR